jgi:hypothetical protein
MPLEYQSQIERDSTPRHDLLLVALACSITLLAMIAIDAFEHFSPCTAIIYGSSNCIAMAISASVYLFYLNKIAHLTYKESLLGLLNRHLSRLLIFSGIITCLLTDRIPCWSTLVSIGIAGLMFLILVLLPRFFMTPESQVQRHTIHWTGPP